MTRQPAPTRATGRPHDTRATHAPAGPSLPELPADHAFVVQFRAQAPGESARAPGRVEHVVTGRTARFESWEQLRRFIEEVLDDRRSR